MDIMRQANDIERNGNSVVHFEVGQPSLGISDSIKEYLKNAIDNDIETMFHSARSEINPWLQIELEYVSIVNQVIIHNRRDCCGNRMWKVALRVGLTKFIKGMEVKNDEICATYQGPGTDGEIIMINCSRAMKGHYISIHLMQDTAAILNLNEVMIYGHTGKKLCS